MFFEPEGISAVAAVLAGYSLLSAYVRSLPRAPACPDCRSVTRAAAEALGTMRLPGSVAVTEKRECTRCGWRGRMRWRWAVRRIRENENR